jgi:hypothetical protein
MRRRIPFAWLGVAAGLLSLGFARDGAAAVIPFTGELALQISAFDPVGISGAGFATVEGRQGDSDHLASMRLDASTFGAAGILVPVSDPEAFPIAGVLATAANGAGSFAENPQGEFGGVLPVLGVAKVCLFGTCSAAVSNLSVPLTVVGQGGLAMVTGAVNLTVIGAPWTTGAAAVGTTTARGFARGPGSGTTSTLNASGTVRLVTPIFISTNIGASPVVPAFGFLTLHFVPEPGTALLVGLGVIGMVGAGRMRSS